MGIVRFALKFPDTLYVLAGLVLFLGGSAIVVTPTDSFPPINIPVVTVIGQYTGLTQEEMARCDRRRAGRHDDHAASNAAAPRYANANP